MMGISLGHLIVLLVIILLFGGRRLPELGGALGKGLRSFKKGLEGHLDESEASRESVHAEAAKLEHKEEAPKVINPEPATTAKSSEQNV